MVDHDPNATINNFFKVIVNSDGYEEDWIEGLNVTTIRELECSCRWKCYRVPHIIFVVTMDRSPVSRLTFTQRRRLPTIAILWMSARS